MSDLISRKALLDELDNFSMRIGGSANAMALVVMDETKKSIVKTIESQPTSFDLESVIQKIEENKQDMLKTIKESSPAGVYMTTLTAFQGLIEEYTEEQIEILKNDFLEQTKGEKKHVACDLEKIIIKLTEYLERLETQLELTNNSKDKVSNDVLFCEGKRDCCRAMV